LCFRSGAKSDRPAARSDIPWDGRSDRELVNALQIALEFDPELLLTDEDLEEILFDAYYRFCLLRAPPEVPPGEFNVFEIEEADLRRDYRFGRRQLFQLALFLFPSGVVRTDEGDKAHAVDALCIFLREMSSPIRQSDMVRIFHRQRCAISRIANFVAHSIYSVAFRVFSELDLESVKSGIERDDWLDHIAAITDHPVGVWGFMDGHIVHTTRISEQSEHEAIYNGWKAQRGLKYISVMAPNGMTIYLFGGLAASRHDSYLLGVSGLLDPLEELFEYGIQNHPDGIGLNVYADSGFPKQKGLLSAYKAYDLCGADREERMYFNKMMGTARGEVEHSYSLIYKNWSGLRAPFTMTLGNRPVNAYFWSCAWLTNCVSCFNGQNQMSVRFELPVPTLEEYLEYSADRCNCFGVQNNQ